MSAKATGQDPEVAPKSHIKTDDQSKKHTNTDRNTSLVDEKYNISALEKLSPLTVSEAARTSPAKNKRKNFKPRYTSVVEPLEGVVEENVTAAVANSEEDNWNAAMNLASTSTDTLQSAISNYQYGLPVKRDLNMSGSSASPVTPSTTPNARSYFTPSGKSLSCVGEIGGVDQRTEIPLWMQMLGHYEQLVRAAGVPSQQSAGAGASVRVGEQNRDERLNDGSADFSEMADWKKKFGSSESAGTAIRDILKAYRGKRNKEVLKEGIANLPRETEPPTPPTTPHTYKSLLPAAINGKHEHPDPPAYEYSSPSHQNFAIKGETLNSLSSTGASSPTTSCNNSFRATVSSYVEKKAIIENDKGDEDCSSYGPLQQTTNAEKSFENYDDDNSWDCCVPQHQKTTSESGQCEKNVRQWCDDFQRKQPILKQRIKSECGGDTDTTVGDIMDVNTFDEEEDYPPPSPNDFPDSLTNDDDEDGDDDDDGYSVNIFGDDDQSEADDRLATVNSSNGGNERNPTDSTTDVHDNLSLVADKEGSCSNSSSRISVRNLGGFYEVNLAQSKTRCPTDDKSMHIDFVQNMNKFTSYLECQNEMCRIENLREHYHCYDYPCFGKILSKKEEVIRHVKWHRKRMDSLNHGFLRFSSSDDCSTTFGSNCQHNRKQTHYHCFQPNCDRVYISTSDVQMHSNFHRKDSAIHKEGFQRFRANEKCATEYCMFADQKTTHFHCRRDNCRYTFKNKADMEKHKTYHIKDLKLTRDGFKKFLKNEACPYKQCRFSKVCNHIHCARENCFYVLHSSGQLLSHKRKHERMDNEQTYSRYKMLAVKAALMGNVAAVAAANATVSPEESTTFNNFNDSLRYLNELELNALSPRRTGQENSLRSSPKQASASSLSLKKEECISSSDGLQLDFFQQIQKRHQELLNQKQQFSVSQSIKSTGIPEVSMFPVMKETTSPLHQYNMALHPNQLTPSIIQQFFSECLSRTKDTNEPMADGISSDETSSRKTSALECPWKERLDPHLHCIIKDCEAVIPNNILDISAHIRIHGYNRDVYATTAATESLMNPGGPSDTVLSNNPMQITTIDGFFNRKRGRPPKNRFVEVYKNAQQSPQAIFTSFKLEKQPLTKDIEPLTCDVNASLSVDIKKDEEDLQINQPLNQQEGAAFSPRNSLSQYKTYKDNQNCLVAGGRCPLAMQHHYHCICSSDCTFVTVERELLSVHLERQHTTASFADTISKKFKRFDRNIGLDCGILECRLRKTRPHLHCRQCFLQISPFDLETHVCRDQRDSASFSTQKKSLPYHEYPRIDTESHPQLESVTADSFASRLPSVTFSTLTELRKKVSEIEPETISVSQRPHEDDKIWVVRAAGTYFPENTSNDQSGSGPSFSAQQRPLLTNEDLQIPLMPLITTYCSIPYCKLKRRIHEHCEYCEQSFVDPAKCQAHKSKHVEASSNQRAATHSISSHSTGDDSKETRSNIKSPISYKSRQVTPEAYDEQPQDLSVCLNTTATAIADGKTKSSITESVPNSTTVPLLTPTPVHFRNLFPQDLMSSFSMQNFHFTQLASLYQQNPYYYQHLYPFLSNAAALSQHHRPVAQSYSGLQGNENRSTSYLHSPAECAKSQASATPGSFPFLSPLLMARNVENIVVNKSGSPPSVALAQSEPPKQSPGPPGSLMAINETKSLKRKLGSNDGEEFAALIDALSPSTKKQMQFAAGLAAVAAAATAKCTSIGSTKQGANSCRINHGEQHGQHFKIKDEQIPTGYLKFRFNEDCYFPKCGYRNHQSHFHCDRNDCHYSFCDKTRFVQHTARHERLDKLMGNDFRQYRANMNCGYENCPYFKNLGSANKSSHFHCLKCDFICSDTNKVVAHRRQHSKMEYIRMAGFRKVTNSEKCNSSFEATVATNGNELLGTVECSYSQKQTHYHCLVCDVSVLSRAQLSSHKHKA